MKRSIALWQLLGFGVTSLLGTLLHFLYDLLGKSPLIASFSGVNESTWEHLKLLFFPLVTFAFIQSIFFKDYNNFWYIKLIGIITGLVLIPVIFYTYNGTIGKSPDWINIAIFFISAAAVFLFEAYLLKNADFSCKTPQKALIIIGFIALLFFVFTFFTPRIPLFRDPVNNTYGINHNSISE